MGRGRLGEIQLWFKKGSRLGRAEKDMNPVSVRGSERGGDGFFKTALWRGCAAPTDEDKSLNYWVMNVKSRDQSELSLGVNHVLDVWRHFDEFCMSFRCFRVDARRPAKRILF